MHNGIMKFTENWTEENWGHQAWLYYRMVEMVDVNVGYILDTLEQSPDHKNTVIIFTSDHGVLTGTTACYLRIIFMIPLHVYPPWCICPSRR